MSAAAHSDARLNVLKQILASQIASVLELGNLGQLLWRDPLKQDTDNLIREKISVHRINVMVSEYGCLVLVTILSDVHNTLLQICPCLQ